ncbi:UDP-N-acetylglucosamine:LPS N-acetylglucosamine transferase [Bacillus oleivorans]|uniref:UDP-N-acetylglucosamine:LPS N-acetylglucosamine transferase n=1 Tax=Bacillus oleivorans TaxID=1448271 RepID=A0A285CML9_9BACI|nr:glycosyltransferase [Bacillus oleivorans]SNX68789.1 UDP-N-acetylglucosamine:LPS N-acetylglucosamine transferase [Bacillus oleivorans]
MKRVLFMPFLRISSGHHHVADGIIKYLEEMEEEFDCEKVDILSYTYGPVEKLVSLTYLKWIHSFPDFYSWLYRQAAIKTKPDQKRAYRLFKLLFLSRMRKLIAEKKPDVIICTHALPSFLLNELKTKKIHSIPVMNVYTDYFINQIWGTDTIDYHLVPSREIMEELVNKGVNPEQIHVTGIPVHPHIRRNQTIQETKTDFSVLISGGNLGAGALKTLIQKLQPSGRIRYLVLCGKNEKLYQFIDQLNHPKIRALPYISSKLEISMFYDEADAIITKPGGVTVSECLMKKIPIFIYHALPGQEEVNFQFLIKKGLAFELRDWEKEGKVEKHILAVLQSKQQLEQLYKQVNQYHAELAGDDFSDILKAVLSKMNEEKRT